MARRSRFVAVALAGVVWAQIAVAAPPRSGRALGSRASATTAQQRRLHRPGRRVRQPRVKRPRGLSRLSRGQSARALRALQTQHPERSLDSLRPGFESYRAVRARAKQLLSAPSGPLPSQGSESPSRASRRVTVKKIATIDGLGIDRIDIRSGKPGAKKILIVGGVHGGSEVVGTEAAMRLAERALKDPAYANLDITIIPLLNPTGMVLGTRHNTHDTDVNRTLENGKSAEARVIRAMRGRERFDAVIDLHGSRRANGFFVLRGKDDGGMANHFLSTMPSAALSDAPGSGGQPTQLGPYRFDQLGSATSDNGGTIKGYFARWARYSYTFEAPTRLDPGRQVRGLLRLAESALFHIAAEG